MLLMAKIGSKIMARFGRVPFMSIKENASILSTLDQQSLVMDVTIFIVGWLNED